MSETEAFSYDHAKFVEYLTLELAAAKADAAMWRAIAEHQRDANTKLRAEHAELDNSETVTHV